MLPTPYRSDKVLNESELPLANRFYFFVLWGGIDYGIYF